MTSAALALSRPRSVRDVPLGAGLARALGQPVVMLFIASSALGLRLHARR
jgi:hypothetical protein